MQDEGEERCLRRLILSVLVRAAAGFLAPEHPGRTARAETQHDAQLVQLAACLTVRMNCYMCHNIFAHPNSVLQKALGVETESELETLLCALRLLVRCAWCRQQPPVQSCEGGEPHQLELEAAHVLQGLRRYTAARAVQAEPSTDEPLVPQAAGLSPGTCILPPLL